MKRFKYFLFLFFLMIIFIPFNISASSVQIYIGDEVIYADGVENNIYGGKVIFEAKPFGNYLLTLENVNIDELSSINTSSFGINFSEGNLIVKLVGNNTISAANTFGSSFTSYSAISVFKSGETRVLSIIGDGTLNMNVSGYDIINGLYSDRVFISQDGNSDNPTINSNLVGTDISQVILINGEYSIYNANIYANVDAVIPLVFYNPGTDSNTVIKDSDINITMTVSDYGTCIYSWDGDTINIENTDMLIKGIADNNNVSTILDVFSDSDVVITLKDSRIVLINGKSVQELSMSTANYGRLVFTHTSDNKYLFLTNNKIDIYLFEFNNINNNIIYTSDISLDKVVQDDNFNPFYHLQDKHYVVISPNIDNKILDGNNQKFDKNNISSYSLITNHFRYLVKDIKLDGIVLDSNDYNLYKDGKVNLTDSGINKLNLLDAGTHKIDISYYYGNAISSSFDIIDISKNNNPKTGDNIISIILHLFISLIGLLGCIIVIKKIRD